jgi:hypothetical protein
MPVRYEFGSDEFHEAVREPGHRAFLETLAAGLPVFYLDRNGVEVMEQPDRRKFEIRWIPGAPSGSNYEVVRELSHSAA